jgi:hypothetical protein
MSERDIKMDDRRSNGRTRISKAASLFFGGKTGVHSCDVKLTDITTGGAGIHKQDLALVPLTFELSFDNLRRKCRLVWRKGNFFGVAFENQNSPSNTESRVGEAETMMPAPAFSMFYDQPKLGDAPEQDIWAELGSKVRGRKDQRRTDLRFMVGVAIALTLPVFISLGAYLVTTMVLRSS